MLTGWSSVSGAGCSAWRYQRLWPLLRAWSEEACNVSTSSQRAWAPCCASSAPSEGLSQSPLAVGTSATHCSHAMTQLLNAVSVHESALRQATPSNKWGGRCRAWSQPIIVERMTLFAEPVWDADLSACLGSSDPDVGRRSRWRT